MQDGHRVPRQINTMRKYTEMRISYLFRKTYNATSLLFDRGPSELVRVINRKYEVRRKKRQLKKILILDGLEDRFSEIMRQNFWKTSRNKESVSGPGSMKERAARYKIELSAFLSGEASQLERPIILFDAPCGDLNWIADVAKRSDVNYLGADIVHSIIEGNKSKYPGLKFDKFDITKDSFPDADVWHCRDCLFHLSFGNIWNALANYSESGVPNALLTSHIMNQGWENKDIEDGDFRFLDLSRHPFHFPTPKIELDDSDPDPKAPRRIVGLYSRETVINVLSRHQMR